MAKFVTKQFYGRASDSLFSVNFDTEDYNLKDWNTLHIKGYSSDYGLFIYKNPIIISGDDVFDIKTDKDSNYVAGSSVAANEYAGYIYKLYSYPILDSKLTNLTSKQKDEIFGTTNGQYILEWSASNFNYPDNYTFPFAATKLNLASGETRFGINKLPFTGPSDSDIGKNNTTEALFEDLPLLGRSTLPELGKSDYWVLFGKSLNDGTISAQSAYTSKIVKSGTSTFNFYAGTPIPIESASTGVNIHCCRPWDIIVDDYSFTIIGVEAKAK